MYSGVRNIGYIRDALLAAENISLSFR